MLDLLKALFGGNAAQTSLLAEASDRFLGMLDQAHELLVQAVPHLLDKDAPEELDALARQVDKTSNRTERDIRKMLVEHLAFDHSDGPTCLVLMSVSKDAERLIDECRNLMESKLLIKSAVPSAYADPLRELSGEVSEVMQKTREAFANNDEQAALALVEGEKPFIARLQMVYDSLLDDDSLNTRQAVIISRALRYIQRMRAHLANIASTVVFPVHRIDFAKRSFVRQAKERIGEGDDTASESPKDSA
ncbi:MAG: hypothetical protein PF961_08200 [Planctomycetota bacterium]|jgi:phosphate uptake regulator|nr:hypothetical protein [Planctomycetota bacterium]